MLFAKRKKASEGAAAQAARTGTSAPAGAETAQAEEQTSYEGDICVKGADLYYGDFQALKNISIDIPEKNITAFIGPSGCGKSTFLKCFNRMNDLVQGCKITGEFRIGDVDIYGNIDVNELRRIGGGMAVVGRGRVQSVPLDIAGLISSLPADEYIRRSEELLQAAYDLGVSRDYEAFMSLSFLALPVIPALKLTDKGLFDVTKFDFCPVDAAPPAEE